ncbi:hypothetical protein DFH28DRAFT_1029816 [Melampsora americana]|nr:hypothetical protein DFH28DRAFT_1029816 [Melampsora americana]
MVYSNDHVNRLSTFTENGSSIDDLSSNSIQSTLNTSITSSQPKSTYQPRPLLLSSFNHQYNKSNVSSSSDHSTSKFKKQITILERRQLERHQDEILQEFKQKQKQKRLNELSNLSSKINPSYQNPDDDHWDWLSSDSDHQAQDDEKDNDEDDDDDTEESMAVVWRASLDVGRKVSKNRKALGKSSVLKKSFNSIHSSNPNPNSNQIKSQVLNHSIKLNKTQSILFNSISLLKSYIFNHHPSSTNSPWNHSTKLILFGSGLLAGVFSSTFSSLILGSHSLQRSHLGFFINFLFPSDLTLPNNLIGWSTPHLIRLTGIGIYYHCFFFFEFIHLIFL